MTAPPQPHDNQLQMLLLCSLAEKFAELDAQDCQAKSVYLNPQDFAVFAESAHCEIYENEDVRLWGTPTYYSESVRPGHCLIVSTDPPMVDGPLSSEYRRAMVGLRLV